MQTLRTVDKINNTTSDLFDIFMLCGLYSIHVNFTIGSVIAICGMIGIIVVVAALFAVAFKVKENNINSTL